MSDTHHGSGTDGDHEYRFYVYDDSGEEPRYSFWISKDGEGQVALYDKPPEGHGMWLGVDEDSEYDYEPPSEQLEETVANLMGDGVPGEDLEQLESHERHFATILLGTINEKPKAVPSTVWGWMHDCADRHDVEVEDDE